jgi:hypothetical protein
LAAEAVHSDSSLYRARLRRRASLIKSWLPGIG